MGDRTWLPVGVWWGILRSVVAIGTQWSEHSYLSRLSENERESLLRLGVPYAVARGHVILAQGEQSRHVVILLDGYAKVTATAADHREVLLDVRGRGDVVGDWTATNIGYLSTGGTTAARPGLVEVTGGVALTSAAHRCLVWLTHGVRPAGHRGAERLKRGLLSSK
jgi:hypothetical protein